MDPCAGRRGADGRWVAHLRPLTPAQRAYLAVFEEWLRQPSDLNQARRENALELLLVEADVDVELVLSKARRRNRRCRS